jgi:rare lipoprotein A
MPLPSYARVTNLDNGRSIIVRVNDRGPYARNRIIDVSIGAANALRFYGDGLAHVRVEYVGRAPIEGSDDRVLLATLREGAPAAVPSQLMVASAAPFVPGFDEEAGTPIPAERPFALGTGAGSGRVAAQPAPVDVASVNVVPVRVATIGVANAGAPERSAVKLPAAKGQKLPDLDASGRLETGPVAFYAPVQNERALGLMSGRGLY